jgi:hypothetical protein
MQASGAPLDLPFEVVLSFAGEERSYVERVAHALKSRGVRVFYDAYEEVALWGKDLHQHLQHIYSSQARFCVVFVSAAYVRKVWPRHELRSAQARAIREKTEYVLPARFDDTEVPELLSTIGYVDLRSKSPEQFADIVISKLGQSSDNTGTLV